MTAQEKHYQLDQASTGSEGWAHNDVFWAHRYFALSLLCSAERGIEPISWSRCLPVHSLFKLSWRTHPDRHHSALIRPLFSPSSHPWDI